MDLRPEAGPASADSGPWDGPGTSPQAGFPAAGGFFGDLRRSGTSAFAGVLWGALLLLTGVGQAPADGQATPPVTQPATQPAGGISELGIEVSYLQATTSTGRSYLAARQRLLSLPAGEVRRFLRQRHEGTPDPVVRLWLEALLLRLERPVEIEYGVQEALRAAAPPPATGPAATTADPDPSPSETLEGSKGPPPAGRAASSLQQHLGDSTAAVCAELIIRRVLPPEARDQRKALVLALALQGQSRGPGGEVRPAREPRAANVLLWILVHEDDTELLTLAGTSLRRFASPQTLAAVRELIPKSGTPARRKVLELCLQGLEAELRATLVPLATRPHPATDPSPPTEAAP